MKVWRYIHMNKVLCSSGAIIGKANNCDHTLLKEYAPKLNCDGYELMMYSAWYPVLDDVISDIKSYGLDIPVMHSQKSLGEALCGMKAFMEHATKVYGARSFEGECAKENIGSANVMKKLGMVYDHSSSYSKNDGSATFESDVYALKVEV